LRHLYIKCIILPRQARDKHRENSKNGRFLQGHPSSWQLQEADLAQRLAADKVRREQAKEARAQALAKEMEEAAAKEAAALSAEQELAEARAQIHRLTQQLQTGQSIAEVTIADLERRLAQAEGAMVAVGAAKGLEDEDEEGGGMLPGEISISEETREERRKEKEEMKKRLDSMGVKHGAGSTLKHAAPIWGLHLGGDTPADGGRGGGSPPERDDDDDDVVAVAEAAIGQTTGGGGGGGGGGSPGSSPQTKLEEETIAYKRQVAEREAERERQQRHQDLIAFRSAEVRRQLESMKAISAGVDDDGADDGGFSDEFESLFNNLREEYIKDEIRLADKRRAEAQVWSDDEEEEEEEEEGP
jgi:hypothetical protein